MGVEVGGGVAVGVGDAAGAGVSVAWMLVGVGSGGAVVGLAQPKSASSSAIAFLRTVNSLRLFNTSEPPH